MDLIVRPAGVEDAEQIVAILNPIVVGGSHTVLDRPFSAEAERDYIRRFPKRGIFLVALEPDADRIVGFQSLEPFDAPYTRAFEHVGVIGTYVAETDRRRGVARALFRETIAAAESEGFEKIFGFVRADNPAALAAYRAQGFSVVGTAKNHAKLDGRYIDEIFIELQLVDR